jgi:hypothetical protein
MNIQTKQIISALLAVASSAGVVGTAYLAVKETSKAEENKKKFLEEHPDASKKDIILNTVKSYKRTIAIGVATISSVIVSHMLSKKAEASLIAGATLLEQGWSRYQYKVKDILGIESHKKVMESIANDESKKIKNSDKKDGRELYFVDPIGYFWAKPEELAWAYGDMNQRLHTVDKDHKTAYFCLLWDMLKDANAELVDGKMDDIPGDLVNWGWSSDYLAEVGQPDWIHMSVTKKKNENGVEYNFIEFDVDPIKDPSFGGGMYLEKIGVDIDNPAFQEEPSTFRKVIKTNHIEVKENKDE